MSDWKDTFSASDARNNMNNLDNPKNKNSLNEIIEKINDKSKNNEDSLSVNDIPTVVRVELEKRGFKVKFYNSLSSDPREGSYYSITW